MKKSLAVLVISVLVLCILPASFAISREKIRSIPKDKAYQIKEGNYSQTEQLKEFVEKHPEVTGNLKENIKNLDEKRFENMKWLDSETLRKLDNVSTEEFGVLARLDQKKLEKIKNLDIRAVKAITKLNRAKREEIFSNDTRRINETVILQLKEERDLLKNTMKKRVISHEQEFKSKKQLELAKAKYFELKDEIRKRRQEFNKVKAELKDCQNRNTLQCEQLDVKATQEARQFLNNTIDQMSIALLRVKENLKLSVTLTNEQVLGLVHQIDTQIEKMSKTKQEMESAATKDQVKKVAREVQSFWSSARKLMKVASANLISSRIGLVIAQSSALEARLEGVLTRLEESKEKTDDVDTSITEFSNHIEASKAKFDAARAILDSTSITDEAVTSAQALLKDAHQEFKIASSILNSIVSGIKKIPPLSNERRYFDILRDKTSIILFER